MQFEIKKQILLKAISDVNGAVEKRNTIPILQNIKIEVNNDIVVLSATDMDIVINTSFESDMKNGGVTTVPAQMFFDIVRKIPEGLILIKQDKPSILEIVSGKSKFNLPCIDASEFPSLFEGELSEEIEIDAIKLAKMIDKTRFAVSNDETRYYLNGLFLQAVINESGSELRTVGTDGHRLALSFMQSDLKDSFGIIVPKKSINEIRRVIDGISKKVKIAVSRIKIKVIADNTTIVSKLIDGEFPEYDKVVPKNNSQLAIINKKMFYDAVDRASTVANDKHKSIKLVLENGKMNLQVSTNEGSYAHEEIDINYQGEKIETGFNSRYLLEIISNIDKEELMMRFKDGSSPAIVEAKDMNSVFVIMPVRV